MTSLKVNGQSIDIGGNGATFTPSVSQDGTLSWTNNGNLDNPEPVNIKGPQGQAGANATINGQNTLTIAAGNRVSLSQSGSTLTVSVPAPDVYSTAETRIGTWIDGKPIYRRVLKTTLGTDPSKDTMISYNMSTVETVVSLRGMAHSNLAYHLAKDDAWIQSGFFHYQTAEGVTDHFSIYTSKNSNAFGITFGNYERGATAYVIFEYTKTTDQATVQTTAAMPASLTVEPAAASAAENKITF